MITFGKLGQMGRLGNQMFLVASTIGIAEKIGQEWALPKWDHPFRFDFPEIDDRNFLNVKIPWGYKNISNIHLHAVPVGAAGGNFSLCGYMQSEKYFKHIEDKIRAMFTFKEYIMKPYPEFISVHVRRGDYDPAHHVLLGGDYYVNALKMLPDLPVVVFTDMDTVEWKGEKSDLCDLVPGWEMVSSSSSDIATMTMASYHVIANSSYSWWGAWLSKSKQVIAPAAWFGPKKKRWSTKDIYPENWTVI